MEILEIKIMRGPNYWSNYRDKLIVMKLDIDYYEEHPTNLIDGFAERLEQAIPTLGSHRCSRGHQGGFLERVREGTWLGHVVEHVALELQSIAGMNCGYGRTRSAGEPGIYNVVFAYEVEDAGVFAAKAAVKLVETIASDMHYNIEEDIRQLSRLARVKFGPSTQSIVDEAKRRGIPVTRLSNQSLIMLGQGVNQKIIQATVACSTSSIAVNIASDKYETKKFLSAAYIPVPEGKIVYDTNELDEAITSLGFPFVIKPLNGNHGRGVTTNITTREEALEAMALAQKISEDVIVERYILGNDYRFLVVNYKVVAVAKRTPAMVIGDDNSTIQELIDETNRDPNRGNGHEKTMTTIKVDEITNSILVERNLTLNTVLPIGEILFLKDTANMSTGGTARDLTDVVHPNNVMMIERVARIMNLDICGVDVIAEDINIPITNKNGAILEVNAGPGFRMHLSPSKGIARNVAAPVLDMLYPGNATSRIPLVAITGTNGKTTTTRLVAHMAKTAGHNVGYTTTDGIYIKDELICKGDCSGPQSARVILRDPIVDFAVLECARGGILRSGLGFDQCDISIVTNIAEDHLGLNGINTLRELGKVKEVVARSTFDQGYSILNADDDIVYNMRSNLDCNIALFSMKADNPRVIQHCEGDGLAVVVEKEYVMLCRGKWKTRIAKLKDIPLTFSGTAYAMIKNILPAVLAGAISKFSDDVIASALMSFIPSPEMTPGRMNMFRFDHFRVMVDYAHNPAGYEELGKYLGNVPASTKVGIIAATGDRRDEDIRELGRCAARMFDEIIIRHDRDGRGRSNRELTTLLLEGIHERFPDKNVNVISTEREALDHAIRHARPDAFIFAAADSVHDTIDMVKDAMKMQTETVAK